MIKQTVAALALLTAGTSLPATADTTSWISQIGGKGAEVVAAVVETSDQRVCATGTFWSTAEFGAGEHAVKLHTPEAEDIFVACYQANGDLHYAKRFGASRGDVPRALTALPNGDVLVAGLFTDTFGLDKSSQLNSNGNAEMFLMRLDQQGEVVWSKQFGGKLADSPRALAVSAQGEIVMVGSFEGLMTYKVGERVPKVNSAGARDAVVMKLDKNGNALWAERFGGNGYDVASAVALRKDGSIIVAGTFQNEVKVDSTALESRGFRDVYVQALDANGKNLWVQQFGGVHQDNVAGVVVDQQNRIHIAGDFHKTMTFTPTKELISAGSTDVYVARLSASGELEQAQRFGGTQIDQVYAMSLADNDGLLLAGHYQGTTDIDPDESVVKLHSPSANNSSGYVLALDANGKHIGSQTLGGLGVEMALGVSPRSNGDIAIVGLFNNDFDVSPHTTLERRGKTDIYVLSLTLPVVASLENDQPNLTGSIH